MSIDLWLLYKFIMMAIATAASAAAIVIINIVKNTPSSFDGYKYLLKATKLMLTLFNINSIDINIVIIFLLVNNPYIPMKNKAVLTKRICVKRTSFILNFLGNYRFGNKGYFILRNIRCGDCWSFSLSCLVCFFT